MQKYDVIIIGGGIVGLTLAALLVQAKFSIALIDQQTPPESDLKSPYDIRVSAIHHASKNIFQSLNAWEKMQQLRVSAYKHMRVWDANSPAKITFDAQEVGQADLGYIVEHSVMRQVLWHLLKVDDHVHVYHSLAPAVLHEKTSTIEIQLNNGEKISASLLVGADGKNSWVAKQAFFADAAETVLESAVIATIKTEHPHQYTALQRFLSTGPVALLPLADPHLVSLVWSTTNHQAATLKNLSADEFNQTLTSAIESALGKLTVCDERAVFPLVRHQAKNYVKSRVALVGDAAHTILPLAGQGLNLGLMDAACLAEVIIAARQKHRDIGEFLTLRRYERARKSENTAMKLAMEGFYRCFGSSLESARVARFAGFGLVQKLPWIKKVFMQRAMGIKF